MFLGIENHYRVLGKEGEHVPHAARKKSNSGFYHVVPKGIHDQLIFEDDRDRRHYLSLLEAAKEHCDIKIHAYCLMSNHVHLILEDRADRLAEFMKLVDEKYGTYFAEKTGRKGGIFVRPLWSEPIEKDSHLLCAVRYIHANPAVAGICPASAYEWSSAKDYLGRRGLADVEMVLDMLGGRQAFIRWSKAENSTAMPFPGSRLVRHLADEEMATIAEAIIGFEAKDLVKMCVEQRKEAIELLLSRGLPVMVISRLSGLGRKEIYKYQQKNAADTEH